MNENINDLIAYMRLFDNRMPPSEATFETMSEYLLGSKKPNEVGLGYASEIYNMYPRLLKDEGEVSWYTDGKYMYITKPLFEGEFVKNLFQINQDRLVPYMVHMLYMCISFHEASHCRIIQEMKFKDSKEYFDALEKSEFANVQFINKSALEFAVNWTWDIYIEKHFLPMRFQSLNNIFRLFADVLFQYETMERLSPNFSQEIVRLHAIRSNLSTFNEWSDKELQCLEAINSLGYSPNHSKLFPVTKKVYDIINEFSQEQLENMFNNMNSEGTSEEELDSESGFNDKVEEIEVQDVEVAKEQKYYSNIKNSFKVKEPKGSEKKDNHTKLVSKIAIRRFAQNIRVKQRVVSKDRLYQASGSLQSSALDKFFVQDNIFKQNVKKQKKKNKPSVQMMLDFSGSMGFGHDSNLQNVASICYELFEAFTKNDVSCAAYGYSSGEIIGIAANKQYFLKSNYEVTTRNNKERFENAINQSNRGGTPDAYALKYALDRINLNSENNHFIIMLGDGEPNVSTHYRLDAEEELMLYIQQAKEKGVQVICFTDGEYMANNLKKYYGHDNVFDFQKGEDEFKRFLIRMRF